MRHVMWVSIGTVLGCALCAYLVPEGFFLALALVFAIVTLAGSLAARCWTKAAFLGLVFLGCTIGTGWFGLYHAVYLTPAMTAHDTIRETLITASGYGYETDYGAAVDGHLTLEGKRYSVRVYLDELNDIQPGDALRGTFRLRFTAPKEGELTSYYQSKGIFLVASQRDEITLELGNRNHIRYLPARLARMVRCVLEEIFPADTVPFVLALLLGEDELLTYQQDTAFKISGIRHVIAVSGLHVAMLYAVVSRLTFRKRLLTLLVGLPVLLLFSGMAGFTPSVVRSCIMVGLMMVAEVTLDEYDAPTALAASCLVLMAVNPLTVTSVSFQLSVLCVIGILMFQKPIQTWMLKKLRRTEKEKSKIKQSIASSVSMTISAMAFTAPLSALYFGTVSLVGVLTNFLTLWVINFLFTGIIAACAISFLSKTLASILGWILAWPVRYVLLTADILSKFPLAAVYTASSYITLWLIFSYCLLALFWFCERKRPAALLCCVALTLCLALGCSWLGPIRDECRVTMLDVGQGQSILIQSRGRTFLVDCGGDTDAVAADRVAEQLLSQGIRSLDGIILTHGDADHAGGVDELLTRVDASVLLLPATQTALDIPDYSGEIIWVDKELEISFGAGRIRVFPPLFSVRGNENSLCILFETENCAILITGDRSDWGERMLLKRYDLPDVDLLIAGHHGAKDAACYALLKKVMPETVFISVGRNNIYGHPSQELLDRLAEFGCQVFRTDYHGTIVFRR